MPTMTGTQFLAETIKGYGLTHIFFVPALVRETMAALEDSGVRRVVAHSEVAAGYMADGYARASRKPTMCFAQAVGNQNLAAGMREAFLAGSPIIAMTGSAGTTGRYRHHYQVIEDFSMFDAVSKFNARVERVDRLPDLLRQAFRVATSGAPGPVHLEIPGRTGDGVQAQADLELIIEEQHTRYPAHRPEPEASRVEEAARALAAAERPVIVAGGGVRLSGAGAELVKLAETLDIPVATTLSGKGMIPENHRLALGVNGRYGRGTANRIVHAADLVFFVGTRVGGLATNNWTIPRPGKPVIQLDVDPEEVGRNYPAKVGLVGDTRVTLRRLIEAVQPASRPAWVEQAQESVRRWHAELAPTTGSDAVPIRPERLCQEISDFLPEGAMLVSDTGHASAWTGCIVELTRPGQEYLRSMGTLGWAFPASIGAKCALPDRPVLCFTGDGGLYYHISELETAARLGINIVAVVNDNHGLAQSKGGLDKAYGGTQRGKAHEMWVFKETNFAGVAEDMGCLGIRVEKPSEIRPALERAFAANRPVLIDAVTDLLVPAPEWA